MMQLFGILLGALALSGCAEPPYTNIDNAQLKALVDQGVSLHETSAARRNGD